MAEWQAFYLIPIFEGAAFLYLGLFRFGPTATETQSSQPTATETHSSQREVSRVASWLDPPPHKLIAPN